MQERIIIYEKFERKRIDSYLALIYKHYSRSYFQKLFSKRKILVNNKIVLSSYKLKYGDAIVFEFEISGESKIIPEKIKLNIIYEDDDIIVVNKQSGIVVNPSYGHQSGTLINGLMAYSKGKYKIYLVHRLDKNTTGLIIFAKNEKSKINISKQLQRKTVKKIYYAAVKGIIVENKGIIEAPLGRTAWNRKLMSVNPSAKKMAVTEFDIITRKDDYTLVKVRIITGRTHQIRSHMQYINHPIIGDKQYGGPETINGINYERQMLHARYVTFVHPKTSETVNFVAELPSDMEEIFKI
ncbi:MAG: RluA family pseudouridine synthase [Endomicrobium sp.]|jgi:23S rRNA pseudouridine1911/1915/1917 synthase|nr:RluA family pseudouridine synthase [Endomicrobium sp.]